MDWFRKLGHGRRAAESTSGRTEHEKPVKDSFRHQASLGLSGTSRGKRKQQAMIPDTRRRSVHSHHGSSMKSNSIRSSRPTPPFSPPRTQGYRYPRAATFMTRSDASPGSSFISSIHSHRSESEHSLAESYLDVDDPDARSFVPSVAMADEDASLRPFPPSVRRSSTPRSMSSIDRLGGRQSLRSHISSSPLPPFIHTRRNSHSTTTTTHSSFGAASRTWTNDPRGTPKSVDTRPTTIISSLDLPQRVAHIAQVPPPQPSAISTRPHPAGAIHRTLTWDSGLSASPSIPSPLGTGTIPRHPRSILENPNNEHPQYTSPPASPGGRYPCNVPRHSHPHPRDNPRPLARPEENASLVTLASSEFARPEMASEAGGSSVRRGVSPSRDLLGPPLVVQAPFDPQDQDSDQQYTDATPMIGSADPGDTTSSPRRAISYFDRASSTYYFTSHPTGAAGSILTSSVHAGHPTTSVRSHEDRGVDDRASVTAVRRRGSWESGESSFSGAGQQLGPGARGSFSLASLQHVHRSSSLNQIAGDGAGLSQGFGRLSVVEPRGAVEMRLGEVAT